MSIIITGLSKNRIIGEVSHPTYVGYRCLLHLVQDSHVIASVLAAPVDQSRIPSFDIVFPAEARTEHLAVIVGETGDYTKVVRDEGKVGKRYRVEDFLNMRPDLSWATGECYLDAVAAGLTDDEIVGLITRDYFGREPEDQLLVEALQIVRGEHGYDAYRERLILSHEYRCRRKSADPPPGSIFSQPLVKAVMQDSKRPTEESARVVSLDMKKLEQMPFVDFVRECFLQIFGFDPDSQMMNHLLKEANEGRPRSDLIPLIAAAYGTKRNANSNRS